MHKAIVDFKINGMITAKEFNSLIFGRQIEHHKKIKEFIESPDIKTGWISQKRKKRTAAVKEFLKLNDVKEFYYLCHDTPEYRDDSFKIWYK